MRKEGGDNAFEKAGSLPPLTFLHIRLTISHIISCVHAHNYREVRAITPNDHELLVQSMSEFRYIVFGRFAPSILRTFKDSDYSLAQVASLFILDEQGELAIKQVAGLLDRSVSATSRLLDQLASRSMITRREDERDHRAKRVAITEQGRELIEALQLLRADVQIEMMEYLAPHEQAEVVRGMVLLANAGKKWRAQHESSTTRTEVSSAT
jgi:DNA-binding MarR family transcriptional regulator